MKSIAANELKEKMDKNEIVLIEVLGRDEYSRGHIPGAIHIPLDEIGRRVEKSFDKKETIVVYCTDEECSASPVAVRKLEKKGFTNIYHFRGGKKEWRESGFALEKNQQES